MNALVKVENQDLSVVEYQGKRVVTFAMVDQVHQRPEGTARKRFNDNRERFIEGEDYFKVCASEIRTHKICSISPKAHEDVILITESGYLMLTKSFTDDLAWQVQRQLVNGYFNTQNVVAVGKDFKPNVKEVSSTMRSCLSIAKMLGLKGNQAILSADKAVQKLTGESPLQLLGVTHLHAPVQEQSFTPTEIGKMLDPQLNPRAVNMRLAELGYQTKEGDVWLMTEKGQSFGELLDTGKKHGNGTPVKQLKWYQAVVNTLSMLQ